jgi:hypothetical protein
MQINIYHFKPLTKKSATVALPAELRRRGGPGQNRTDDIQLAKLALSQLSYRPDTNKYYVVKDFCGA